MTPAVESEEAVLVIQVQVHLFGDAPTVEPGGGPSEVVVGDARSGDGRQLRRQNLGDG